MINKKFGRREFLALMAVATSGCATSHFLRGKESQAGSKPNIILIFIDDLGYADVGCYGSRDLLTPNIDKLAMEGARFTDGYVTASICSPSRAGLLTGRYQQRFGHEANTGSASKTKEELANVGLPLTETTLADALKREGYATAAIGKWHLGIAHKFHPLERGFDEFFGFLQGAHSYLKSVSKPGGPLYRNREAWEEKEYLTSAFSREAVDFIHRHRKEPFFLYLPYNAVHFPMEAPDKYISRFPRIKNNRRRTLAAMMSAVDDGVGEIMQALRSKKIERNTLVFFISDNGGNPRSNHSQNTPLRGQKELLYEGGIRTPFIMWWPGVIPPQPAFHEVVSTLDVFATAVVAAKGRLPRHLDLDGVDLLPFLTGQAKGAPRDILFWRQGKSFAVRKERWKLVGGAEKSPELFNLTDDISEARNLSDDEPELVTELMNLYKAWSAGMVEPLWSKGSKAVGKRNQKL
ncbi:sulfatase-like hydrolase/transferase [Candidatus Hydrogenedentota bacterium]